MSVKKCRFHFLVYPVEGKTSEKGKESRAERLCFSFGRIESVVIL